MFLFFFLIASGFFFSVSQILYSQFEKVEFIQMHHYIKCVHVYLMYTKSAAQNEKLFYVWVKKMFMTSSLNENEK